MPELESCLSNRTSQVSIDAAEALERRPIEAAVLSAMAYVELNPIRAGIAETPGASDFTSVQQRVEVWQSRHKSAANDANAPATDNTM